LEDGNENQMRANF